MTQNPLDDTQKMRALRSEPAYTPQQPLTEAPMLDPDDDGYDEGPGGVGCGMTILLLGIVGVFALVIVGLSATAGWTSGQRTAQNNATATSSSELQHQMDLISSDIEAGNYEFADIRLRYLATEAPSLAQMPDLLVTGTALALTRQPTATPTPTETATLTPTETGPTVTPTLEATATLSDPYDLGGRLQRAQDAVSVADWNTAIDNLDVIMGIDPNYEVVRVRNMMSQALTAQALLLFRSGDIGEAIFLTDRAEEFGPINDLEFERYVAQLFISAKSRVGTSDFAGAIRDLNEIRRVAPNYQTNAINQLLFQNYVQYADALTYSASHCSAVQQYTNALQLFNDGAVAGKRSVSQNYCEFGTPTPVGFMPTPDGSNGGGDTTSPIGQP